MSISKRFSVWILQWRFPLAPVALGLLLAAPTLWCGLHTDDLMMRAIVSGARPLAGVPESPWMPFSVFYGGPEQNQLLIEAGWVPWWTDLQCRIAFMRPLAAATHVLDYSAWPGRPAVMHAQSLVWFGLLIAAVAFLYRRLIGQDGPAWAAGLAALLFALDDAHAQAVGWMSNRSSLIAGLSVCLALIAHDRWRRERWRAGLVLGPLALAAGLAAKEEALAGGAYLLAYALFLDRGSWARRGASLLPYALVGVGWQVAYRALGFGVRASGVYIDPVHDAGRFVQEAVAGAPMLLLGQWGFPSSADVGLFCPEAVLRFYRVFALVFLGLVSVLMWPLLKRSRPARFWAVGMLLSLVPACTAMTSERVLMFVGVGGMGLLASWWAGLIERAAWRPTSRGWNRAARGFLLLFIIGHLVLAPLMFPVKATLANVAGRPFYRYYETVPNDPGLARQTAVFVNGTSWFSHLYWIQQRRWDGSALPAGSVHLSPACDAVRLTRPDARTLVVRPERGYLPPRTWRPASGRAPLFSPIYYVHRLEHMVRPEQHPLRLGDRIELPAVAVEITDVDAQGRAVEATFRFQVPLEDPSLRWLRVTGERCAPFVPPAVGRTVMVASPL